MLEKQKRELQPTKMQDRIQTKTT